MTGIDGVWVQNSDQPEVTLDQPVGGSGGGLLIGCVRHPLEVTESPILTWLVGVGVGGNGQVGAPGPDMDMCGNAHLQRRRVGHRIQVGTHRAPRHKGSALRPFSLVTGKIGQVRRPDLLDRSPGMTWTTTAATHVAQAKPFDSERRWWIR